MRETQEDPPSTPSPSPPRTRLQKVRRVASRILLGVLGVVVLVVAYLHTPWGEERLRARIEQRLGERFTTRATLRGLRFSLFRGIDLQDLRIEGNTGSEAIHIETVHVEPRYGALLRGQPVLALLGVHGGTVHVVGKEDGTTNLTGIYKAKAVERLVVERVVIDGIALDLTKPDGTKVALQGLALEGNVDARPASQGARGDIDLRLADLTVDRPGLLLHAQKLSTRVHLELEAGKGPVALGPTKGTLSLARGGGAPYPIELDLPKVSASLGQGELKVAWDAVRLAAVAFATLKVETHRQGDAFKGDQLAELTRLTIDADATNALLGKRILGGDVSADVSLRGPDTALVLDATVRTPGGTLTLEGKGDAAGKAYEITLEGKGIDANRIVALDTVPPLAVGSLTVAAKGSGVDKASIDLAFDVRASAVQVRGKKLDAAHLTGTYRKGIVQVDSLDVTALGQRLTGTADYAPATKALHADLRAQGSLGDTLRALRQSGTTIPSSPILDGIRVVRPLAIRAEGHTDGRLRIWADDVTFALFGGQVHAVAQVDLVAGDEAKGEKRFRAEHVDAHVDLRGLSLAALGKLRGSALPVDGTLAGTVHLSGPVAAPDAQFHLTAALAEGEANLDVAGDARSGKVRAALRLTKRDGAALLTGNVALGLAGRAVDPHAPLSVVVAIPRRSLAELAPLLRPELQAKLPRGEMEASVDVHGTLLHPEGGLSLRLDGPVLPSLAPAPVHADISVQITRSSSQGASASLVHIGATATVRVGDGELAMKAPLTIVAGVDVPTPPSRIKSADLPWTLSVELPESPLASLPLPPERRVGLSGAVALEVKAHGNRRDVFANLALHLRNGSRGGSMPGVSADVALQLDERHATLDLASSLGDRKVLDGHGELQVSAIDFVKSAKGGLGERAMDLHLEVLKTPLSALVAAPLLDASLFGTIAVAGTPAAPRLHGALTLGDYPTLEGKSSHSTLTLDGTLDEVRAVARVSEVLRVDVKVPPRAYLAAKKGEGHVPIALAISAEPSPLARVVPRFPALMAYGVRGQLAAALTANIDLIVHGEERQVASVDVRGPFTLEGGSIRIPSSSRTLDDIAMVIRGEGEALAIERLEAHEHDREKADRKLSASGRFSLASRTADLGVDLADVLLFGGTFGQADAPRASLTGKLGVHADLSGTTRVVDVHVHALELWSPDRFLRAHQQEVTSLGDVLELGDGAQVGKLPRPKTLPSTPLPTARNQGSERGEKTLEVHVRIPHTIHVKQRPLDLYAKGEITVERYGESRVLSGKLTCERGDLLVGGLLHPLDHGEVRMTDEGAFLDLHFQREPSAAALRDFATADGTRLFAHMVGPLGKQKLSFSGVSDGLFETLSVNNGGRVRVLSTPDAPASQTAQLPQMREIRQTAYMAANLPHLAFLTRMNTLADPTEGRFAYGRFERLEGERYTEDGRRRLRTTVRAPAIGQSDGEVEYDLLFQNTPRVVSGVGLVGGSRAGGGPAIFWEWSSND